MLGLETSFDDTGIALYDNQFGLIAQHTKSNHSNQIPYGGIVPQLASENHLRQMFRSLDIITTQSVLNHHLISAIACTKEPGLNFSLLVGLTTTKILSILIGAEVVFVDHIRSHALSIWLRDVPPSFPFISLILTGRTCSAFYEVNTKISVLLFWARDDSIGEVLDKVSRSIIENSEAWGGATISRLANKAHVSAQRLIVNTSNAQTSCSGIKTLMLSNIRRSLDKENELSKSDSDSIRTSLAKTVFGVLSKMIARKVGQTLLRLRTNKLVISGGVSSSFHIISALSAPDSSRQVLVVPFLVRTDNGAMTATLGSLLRLWTRSSDHSH